LYLEGIEMNDTQFSLIVQHARTVERLSSPPYTNGGLSKSDHESRSYANRSLDRLRLLVVAAPTAPRSVNYGPIRGFSEKYRVSYNELCAALHESLGMSIGPAPQLTHSTPAMQIAGGHVKIDRRGVDAAEYPEDEVGWLTAARVWHAMENAKL
jgi:hypothetical protein